MNTEFVVCIPCLNEEKTICNVIEQIEENMPSARIAVFDNNSNDNTIGKIIARHSNVDIIPVVKRGKGNVVREIFRIAKKYYTNKWIIMIDGDETYCVKDIAVAVNRCINDNADKIGMLTGVRYENKNFGSWNGVPLHLLGNKVINRILSIGGFITDDVLSGVRVFSPKFIDRVDIKSRGFDVETEISIKANKLKNEMTMIDFPVAYKDRPSNSKSKINLTRDTFKIGLAVLRYSLV